MQSQIKLRMLMSRRQCAVYNIPPASTARGHCTDDWKGKKILLGFVEVYSQGMKGGIYRILNPDYSLFAEGNFTKNWEQSVDRCYDSARYFAVSIQNESGQRALVGLGFEQRKDAFDFVDAMTKYKQEVEILQNPDKYLGQTKQQDYSLRSGEKISLSFGAGTQLAGPAKSFKPGGGGGGLKKLAPPPKSGGGLSKPPSASFAPPASSAPPASFAPPTQFQPPSTSFAPATYAQPTQSIQPPYKPTSSFQQPATGGGSLYSANWSTTGTSSTSQSGGGGGWGDGFSFGSQKAEQKQTPPPPAVPAKTGGSVNLIDLD